MVTHKSAGAIAADLMEAASLRALEVSKIGTFFQEHVVLGSCIGPAMVYVALSAGLAYAALYSAVYEYEATRARKLSGVVFRRFCEVVGEAGDVRFDGRFLEVWRLLLRELNGQEGIRRIGYAMKGDPSQLVITVAKSCAEWGMRTIRGTGYLPEVRQEDAGAYAQVLEAFHRFAVEASRKVDFDVCVAEGGFCSIDLGRLPTCNGRFDIFISYRRSDGDVYARLLNQEMSHRGFRCFLDVESVANGEYNLQILSALKDAPHFLFVKSVEALNGLDNPDDHVRIELEAARHFRRNVVMVAPPMVPRDMSGVRLPQALEYLKDLRSYKLGVGETYEFCIDQILRLGIGYENPGSTTVAPSEGFG